MERTRLLSSKDRNPLSRTKQSRRSPTPGMIRQRKAKIMPSAMHSARRKEEEVIPRDEEILELDSR